MCEKVGVATSDDRVVPDEDRRRGFEEMQSRDRTVPAEVKRSSPRTCDPVKAIHPRTGFQCELIEPMDEVEAGDVHIVPEFDFFGIDERKADKAVLANLCALCSKASDLKCTR